MIIDLILLVFWVVVLWNYSKECQKMKAYKERYNLATATRIKYDKRGVKKYAVAVVITGIIFVISIVMTNMDADFWGKSAFSELFVVAIVYGLLLGGLLFILFGYHLLAGICYFKRLEKYGYEVPGDKRRYEGMLESLPRSGVQLQGASPYESTAWQENVMMGGHRPGLPKYNKTSKCLMYICILACVVMMGFTFYYLYKWYFMDDDTVVLFVLLLIADALWILPVLLFRNQMNTQKFKDDVEIDANRKNRMNIMSGLLLIVVLVGTELFVKGMAHNMSDYVFKTWMSEDGKKIGEICDVLEIASIDPAISENMESWEETKRSMEAGVDITTWGEPEDKFQESVAKMLEITDFSELKEEFRSTDGPAIVYVKLEGEQFSVQLMNLYPAVDREIMSKSIISN